MYAMTTISFPSCQERERKGKQNKTKFALCIRMESPIQNRQSRPSGIYARQNPGEVLPSRSITVRGRCWSIEDLDSDNHAWTAAPMQCSCGMPGYVSVSMLIPKYLGGNSVVYLADGFRTFCNRGRNLYALYELLTIFWVPTPSCSDTYLPAPCRCVYVLYQMQTEPVSAVCEGRKLYSGSEHKP